MRNLKAIIMSLVFIGWAVNAHGEHLLSKMESVKISEGKSMEVSTPKMVKITEGRSMKVSKPKTMSRSKGKSLVKHIDKHGIPRWNGGIVNENYTRCKNKNGFDQQYKCAMDQLNK